jgi:hypothetical protein
VLGIEIAGIGRRPMTIHCRTNFLISHGLTGAARDGMT